MNASSKSLQTPELCLSASVKLFESLKTFVTEEIRDDRSFCKIEADAARVLDNENCIYRDEQSRKKKRTVFFDENVENEIVVNGRENFIINTVNVICDKLIFELDNRLKSYKEINSLFGLFFLNDEEKEDVSADEVESMITKLTTKYREDIKSNNDCNESVRDEIKHFLILARKEHLWSPAEMYNFLQHG